jgi:hypothetical protein
VTSNGILLLPSEGGGALARPGLIQGLACGSHDDDKSLLLSVRGSNSHLSLSDGGGGHGGLLLIDREVGGAFWHGRQDGSGQGWWWATVVNHRVRSEMSESEEKIDDSDYHVRERCVTES